YIYIKYISTACQKSGDFVVKNNNKKRISQAGIEPERPRVFAKPLQSGILPLNYRECEMVELLFLIFYTRLTVMTSNETRSIAPARVTQKDWTWLCWSR